MTGSGRAGTALHSYRIQTAAESIAWSESAQDPQQQDPEGTALHGGRDPAGIALHGYRIRSHLPDGHRKLLSYSARVQDPEPPSEQLQNAPAALLSLQSVKSTLKAAKQDTGAGNTGRTAQQQDPSADTAAPYEKQILTALLTSHI